MKIFCYRFLRNFESCKVETWYTHGQWADVSCIPDQGQGPITLRVTSLDRVLQFAINENIMFVRNHLTENSLKVFFFCIFTTVEPRVKSWYK